MLLLSMNVNGIRSALRAGLISFLRQYDADVICLQETRCHSDIWVPEVSAALPEYYIYASDSSRKGYSGSCMLSKTGFAYATSGMPGNPVPDEGRFMRVEFGEYAVVSVYVPNGNASGLRLDVKMRFLASLEQYLRSLDAGSRRVVVCGDFNVAHTYLDVANALRRGVRSGLLPSERNAVSDILRLGYIDVVRFLMPGMEGPYSWWAPHSACRERDVGWRFDYVLASASLTTAISSAEMVKDFGVSDHAGVLVEFGS